MKIRFAHAVPLFMSVAFAWTYAAEGGATKDDAVAMVKKGVAYIKSQGADKAYAEFADKENKTWRNQDLYLVVYGLDGTVLSHGANAKMIGKNLIDHGVEILDPATGTGTFICEMLDYFRGQPEKLRHKYKEE